jgi:hypothetical protein
VPGERFARLNDICMLTVPETLIDVHRAFDHGWSENLFERIRHQRISLLDKICSRAPAAMGYLANQLGKPGHALAGFSEEIGPAGWRDTVVVLISEFGRSFPENDDRGTDRRHGSVYWVMGGGINGGRVVGEQLKID